MSSIKSSSKQSGSRIPTVPWNGWLGVVFAVFVFIAAQFIAGGVLSFYPAIHGWSHQRAVDWLHSSTGAQFAYILIAEALMVSAIYGFLKLFNSSFRIIGLKRPRWRDVMYGVAAVPLYYVVYLLTVGIVSHYVTGLNIDQHQEIGFDNVHGAIAISMAFISLVVLPPLVEEIMVRGFLYSSFKKALPTAAAVIMTSLIFASLHLLEGGSSGLLYIAGLDTFILSLVLIFLREKTGSLWASITLHGIKNSIAFIALFAIHLR